MVDVLGEFLFDDMLTCCKVIIVDDSAISNHAGVFCLAMFSLFLFLKFFC